MTSGLKMPSTEPYLDKRDKVTQPTGLNAAGGSYSRRNTRRPRVLAADDQQDILDAIELLLRPSGYDVDSYRSPLLVREALSSGGFDAALFYFKYTREKKF